MLKQIFFRKKLFKLMPNELGYPSIFVMEYDTKGAVAKAINAANKALNNGKSFLDYGYFPEDAFDWLHSNQYTIEIIDSDVAINR